MATRCVFLTSPVELQEVKAQADTRKHTDCTEFCKVVFNVREEEAGDLQYPAANEKIRQQEHNYFNNFSCFGQIRQNV